MLKEKLAVAVAVGSPSTPTAYERVGQTLNFEPGTLNTMIQHHCNTASQQNKKRNERKT